jgi:ABC-type glycerol-3-phosphate transport system permease component
LSEVVGPHGAFGRIGVHVPILEKPKPIFGRLRGLDGWTKVVLLVLIGTMFIGKASVYVELAFGGFFLLSSRLLWDPWYNALTRRQRGLDWIGWPLLISLLYGFGQVIYGSLQGYSLVTALQILLFNIYPVYLFLGIWVGFRHPDMVRTYIRWVAWYTAFYTPVYYLFLNKLSIAGSDGGYVAAGLTCL